MAHAGSCPGALFILAGRKNHHVSCRQQNSRKQRDTPLWNFLDIDRRGQSVAIFDQRLARKQTGCMRIRPDSQMDDVEMRKVSLAQLKVFTNIR